MPCMSDKPYGRDVASKFMSFLARFLDSLARQDLAGPSAGLNESRRGPTARLRAKGDSGVTRGRRV